ncbi:hypothetical protein JCM10908_002250 [Rhodotorula pacifica]|uniref:uncharacterized protein n=1 Tax=Rhodotorula pacifica TaxID=1495444 RepID=UPI003175D59A
MADELVLNFDTPSATTPPSRTSNKAKGGRWTDRAKEKKRTKIEQRRATRPAAAPSAQGEQPRNDQPRSAPTDDSRPAKSQPVNASGGSGRARLEQAVGPAGKKQYISSLFTAEGLPVPSTSSSSGTSAVTARPSNAPLTAAPPTAIADEEEGQGEEEEGPDPAPELSKLGLSREMVTALAGKLGITGPTACQAGAIPRLLPPSVSPSKGKGKGKNKAVEQATSSFTHDAILRAQTGSGKTLTFLLPMLEDLLRLPASVLSSAPTSQTANGSTSIVDRSIGTLALILAPTRELATQIHTVLSSLLSSLPSSSRFSVSPRTLTAGLLVGGANRTHEKRRLRKGCPIVVATPGRLLDHLKTTEAFRLAGEPIRRAGPSGRPGGDAGKGANAAPLGQRGRSSANGSGGGGRNMLGLRWLIVDECDRLMDLGFEEQMRGILEEIQRRSGPASSSFAGSTATKGEEAPPRRRTILCSATASEGVDRLAGMAIGQSASSTRDGDGEEAAATTMPVIGAREDVKIKEPVRKDLTAPAATGSNKRGAADDGEEDAEDVAPEKENEEDSPSTALAIPSGFTPPSQLLHHYLIVPPKLRFVALVALLRKLLIKQKSTQSAGGKVLVFMSCTDAVDFWWKALGKIKMGRGGGDGENEEEWEKEDKDSDADRPVSLHPLLAGIPIYRLHGSLPLKTRLASLNAFSGRYTIEEGKKAGQETDAGVLLCTSVAARGLDVRNVGCVVQVDAPTEGGVTEYVHRVGRTARAGAQGTAYSFVLPNEAEYPSYLESGINAKEDKTKTVKLREVGVEQVLREGYGGEGREYETRATDVQMGFERWVNGSEESAALARKAFQAHIRAYATHPSSEKHLFNLKALHLGHLAKSFGMREAPSHHLAGPARKKARTAGGGAAPAHDGGEGFEVGRRRKTLDAEARMRKLMRGPQANGGGEFQIAGAGELEGLVKGRKLVEHYSPYCSHCKSFAPTWKELVSTYRDAADAHDFHFAQVDCAADGDLCHDHGVKYYPSIFLYTDSGSAVLEFEERRTLEHLGKFVEEHYPVKAERLQLDREAKEDGGRSKEEEEWSAKERVVDEQVGMGKVVKPQQLDEVKAEKVKGKARLPKVAAQHVDDEAESSNDAPSKAKPVLHIVDEPESADQGNEEDLSTAARKPVLDSSKTSSSTDVSTEIDTDTDDSAASPILTSQTPAAADPTTTAKFVRPAFVAQQPPSSPMEKKRAQDSGGVGWPAVDGEVLELDNELGMRLIEEEDAPPSFVKFFAPWCSHCKAMAPAWKELAEDLASDGVRVYQMDCDNKANKKACKAAKVQSYPTLKFFNAGASVEYLGKRDKESMKTFALKAMSATTVKTLSTEGELLRVIQDEPVVVVLLQPKEAKKDDVDIAVGAAKTLMGTSPVYSTSAPALFSLHSIPTDQLTFLTFKAHSRSPYDIFPVPLSRTGTSRQRLEATRHWLRSAKVPLVSELNAATFAELLPAEKTATGPGGKPLLPPLLGLAVLSRRGLGADGLENAKEVVGEMARSWVEKRQARREKAARGLEERDVLWAWVDGDKWAGWARSMYDIKLGARDGPKVVIADPKRMEYWTRTAQGEPLELDKQAVFEVIEQGAYARRIKPHSSRQFLERFAYSIFDNVVALMNWIASHPFLFMGGFALGAYFCWLALKATFAPGGFSSSAPSLARRSSASAASRLGAGAGGLVSRGGYAPIPGPKRE